MEYLPMSNAVVSEHHDVKQITVLAKGESLIPHIMYGIREQDITVSSREA